jgi:chaperonin GroEL
MKKVLFGIEEVLEPALRGAKSAHDLVAITLGPGGGCVAMKNYGSFRITKDGVSVANELDGIKEGPEEIGVSLIQQACKVIGEKVGDGTTTVSVLTYEFMKTTLHLLKNSYEPYKICEALEYISEASKKVIKSHSQEVDHKKMKQVATIACNGDEKTGDLLAKLFEKGYSNILAEESKTGDTYIEERNGFFFDRGPASEKFFARSSGEKRHSISKSKCSILVISDKVSSFSNYLALLNNFAKEKKTLIIVADDFSQEFLEAIMANFLLGTLDCYCFKAPGFGERKEEFLDDLCVFSGAKMFKDSSGKPVEETDLGHVDQLVTRSDSTTLSCENQENNTNLQQRIQYIKNKIDHSTSKYEKEKQQERLARLTRGIGVFFVGCGNDEMGLKEYKERVEDAIYACFNAVKDGVLPGGGSDFLLIKRMIENKNEIVDKFLKCFESPLRTIIKNTGKASEDVVLAQLAENADNNVGFDAQNAKIVNLLDSGILNPSSISYYSIDIACKVVSNFAKTKAFLQEEKEKKDNQPMDMNSKFY